MPVKSLVNGNRHWSCGGVKMGGSLKMGDIIGDITILTRRKFHKFIVINIETRLLNAMVLLMLHQTDLQIVWILWGLGFAGRFESPTTTFHGGFCEFSHQCYCDAWHGWVQVRLNNSYILLYQWYQWPTQEKYIQKQFLFKSISPNFRGIYLISADVDFLFYLRQLLQMPFAGVISLMKQQQGFFHRYSCRELMI